MPSTSYKCSSLTIRRMVYNSLIRPHLEYMLPVWGACKKSTFTNIVRKQKKALRLICGIRNQMEHSSPLFRSCGLIKISDMYQLSVLKYVFRNSTELLQRGHDRNTRGSSQGKLQLPDHIPSDQAKMPLVCFPSVWNNAPTFVREADSIGTLSREFFNQCILSY